MKFRTIVVDPPMRYGAGFKLTGGVNHHYPTMTTPQLCGVPVGDIAADDCALFLWGFCPRLLDAAKLLDAWGFRFATVAFVWVKLNPLGAGFWSGLGRWTNSNVELVFLGVRGKPERLARDVKQIVLSPRGRHSQKPEAVQDRIERLTRGPRLELFARRHRPGWTCTGLDLDGRDVRDAIARLAVQPEPVELLTPEPAAVPAAIERPRPRPWQLRLFPWLERAS